MLVLQMAFPFGDDEMLSQKTEEKDDELAPTSSQQQEVQGERHNERREGGASREKLQGEEPISSSRFAKMHGRPVSFPYRLHHMLEDVEKRRIDHIVSWMPGGRSFKVHKPTEFVSTVATNYFHLTKYKSFKRQLLNYGFTRADQGEEAYLQSDGK